MTQTERRPAGGLEPSVPPPRAGRRLDRTLKHGFDRLFAAVGIVVTAPLVLLIALTLLALGQRRVLRVQKRVGDRGAFSLVSFAAPPEGRYPWAARVLRDSGLAELPQLLSLLRGDLSLIGPRPRYPGEPPTPVRPGMLGLAQGRQATHVLDRDEVFALDAEYAERWSLALDVRVVADDVRRLLSRR
jgi:lipopolysaccharide/colanic/teichoic acid biosynthesis glycosyltransferase